MKEMKKLRVTYNYHSALTGKYKHCEVTLMAADFEAEDCFQEFNARSQFPFKNDDNYIVLRLVAMICTAQIYLAGNVIETSDQNNIWCISDVEVLDD